jgi:hypothetical protein
MSSAVSPIRVDDLHLASFVDKGDEEVAFQRFEGRIDPINGMTLLRLEVVVEAEDFALF